MSGIEPLLQTFSTPDKNGIVQITETYVLKDKSRQIYVRSVDSTKSGFLIVDNPTAKSELATLADPIESEPFKDLPPDSKPSSSSKVSK